MMLIWEALERLARAEAIWDLDGLEAGTENKIKHGLNKQHFT